jgi:hypothetical protein
MLPYTPAGSIMRTAMNRNLSSQMQERRGHLARRFLSPLRSYLGRKIPRVAFKVDPGTTSTPEETFPLLLSRQLGTQFRTNFDAKWAPTGPWILELQLQSGARYAVGINHFNRQQKNEWGIFVIPGRADRVGTLLALFSGRAPKADAAELSHLCRSLHEILKTTPGLSAVRWYCRGAGVAVHTPEELLGQT